MASLPATEGQEAMLLSQMATAQRQTDLLRDELQRAQIDEAAEAGQVEIVDLAEVPTKPLGTGRFPKLFLALLLGLGLGGGIAYVLENGNSVIRRRDDLDRILRLPNLAVIPRIGLGAGGRWASAKQFLGRNGSRRALGAGAAISASANGAGNPLSQLVILSDGRSGGAEAYRTLRTNLLFSAAVNSLRQIVVTSTGAQEGKSTTAANLAVAFAQQGKRVVLIDCDLRKPRVHKIFDLPQQPGLTNVLLGATPLAIALQESRVEGLQVLTCGPIPPNPVELLGSSQMQEMLASLDADVVVLDTPPLLVASDAAVLGRMSNGVVMVVRAGKTHSDALQTAVQQLHTVGARIIGTVLNDPDAEVAKYESHYQYYYQNYYEGSET
jgi:capsular exopolysaccharide synthesis family protein